MVMSRRTAVLLAAVVLLLVGAAAVVAMVRTRAPEDTGAAAPSGSAAVTEAEPSSTAGAASAGPTAAAATVGPTPAPTPVPPAPSPSPEAPSSPPTTGQGSADIVLTYYGWDTAAGAATVGAYVPMVDSGGTCELTMSQGGTVRSATSAATPDAATTSCGEISLPASALAPGTWTAVVTYASPTTAGSSAPVTIEVP